MAPRIERATHKIDATGQSIGRLASNISKILQGKNKPTYEPNRDLGDYVEVTNAAKLKLTGAKREQKKYYSYSGYPGGLRTTKLSDVMQKNPGNALARAVKDMLPKNRLRQDRLKRLTISNS